MCEKSKSTMKKEMIRKMFEVSRMVMKSDKIVLGRMTRKEFNDRFEKALKSMKSCCAKMLIKTYDGNNKFWWVDDYPKTTFYRQLSQCENAFLFIFESVVCED